MQALGDDERFKRLKVFLEAKLKGVKFATFRALHREFIDLRKARMLNNERAKKVGTYLEMIARGLTARQFGAFKRYLFIARAEREEEARLAALIAERDSQSLQRLKVFLQGKEKRQMYGMFSWWSNCTFNSKGKILQKELEKAKKARLEAEAACEALRKALGADAAKAEAMKKLKEAEDRLKEIENESELLKADIENEKKRIKELEEAIANEKAGRKADKEAREKLQEQYKTIQDDKKSLEAEL